MYSSLCWHKSLMNYQNKRRRNVINGMMSLPSHLSRISNESLLHRLSCECRDSLNWAETGLDWTGWRNWSGVSCGIVVKLEPQQWDRQSLTLIRFEFVNGRVDGWRVDRWRTRWKTRLQVEEREQLTLFTFSSSIRNGMIDDFKNTI